MFRETLLTIQPAVPSEFTRTRHSPSEGEPPDFLNTILTDM